MVIQCSGSVNQCLFEVRKYIEHTHLTLRLTETPPVVYSVIWVVFLFSDKIFSALIGRHVPCLRQLLISLASDQNCWYVQIGQLRWMLALLRLFILLVSFIGSIIYVSSLPLLALILGCNSGVMVCKVCVFCVPLPQPQVRRHLTYPYSLQTVRSKTDFYFV